MGRTIPVWFVLLILLLGSIGTMLFGWVVKVATVKEERVGMLGQAAVAVASFPDMVRSVYREMQVDPDERVRVPAYGGDLAGFSPAMAKPGLDVTGLMIRADRESVARAAGVRVLVGAFTIGGRVQNAALALNSDLEIVKVWVLEDEGAEELAREGTQHRFVHGFDVLPDGSVIFGFDRGVSLQRVDHCGTRVWSTKGEFHHAVTLTDDNRFAWTLLDDSAARIDVVDGNVVQRVSIAEIIAANPLLDILGMRQQDVNGVGGNKRNSVEKWLDDPFHLNDVEPLPQGLAERFPVFEAGDLLLSSRSNNLVFVVDPDTLAVKWWRAGAWRRQHDPDWQPAGFITVYDNRMSRDYSRIVGIDPTSFGTQVLFDGSSIDFYSRIRGKHEFTAAGNLLVASSQQGRVFEVDGQGRVILEIINKKPGDDRFNYAISEALWLPPQTLDFLEETTCAH